MIFMFGYEYEKSISDASIEEKARDLGMRYPDEMKAMYGKDEN